MAIILQTPFVVLLKNNGQGMDNRLLGLLERLGLQDRIYNERINTVCQISGKNIDWICVERKLAKEKASSLAFIIDKCGL